MADRATICLVMIVRDESRVIRRCLDSVRPFIDCWCIVDTGSEDDTPAIVEEHLSDVPGKLHHRPWRDFATNRSEALSFADSDADYALVIDADEELVTLPEFEDLPALTADSYQILTKLGEIEYLRTQLLRTGLGWHYVGVLHEVAMSPRAKTIGAIPGLINHPHTDGARSRDPDKFAKDASVLREAFAREPDNARYAFYLAQSLRDAGDVDGAIEAYDVRSTMPGFEEESWYAMFQSALLRSRRGDDRAIVVDAFLRAHQRRPSRAEALCSLAHYCRINNDFELAYIFGRRASEITRPADLLFVDTAVYAWRATDECAVAAHYAGRSDVAVEANSSLLASDALPNEQRARIQNNQKFYLASVASKEKVTARCRS